MDTSNTSDLESKAQLSRLHHWIKDRYSILKHTILYCQQYLQELKNNEKAQAENHLKLSQIAYPIMLNTSTSSSMGGSSNQVLGGGEEYYLLGQLKNHHFKLSAYNSSLAIYIENETIARLKALLEEIETKHSDFESKLESLQNQIKKLDAQLNEQKASLKSLMISYIQYIFYQRQSKLTTDHHDTSSTKSLSTTSITSTSSGTPIGGGGGGGTASSTFTYPKDPFISCLEYYKIFHSIFTHEESKRELVHNKCKETLKDEEKNWTSLMVMLNDIFSMKNTHQLLYQEELTDLTENIENSRLICFDHNRRSLFNIFHPSESYAPEEMVHHSENNTDRIEPFSLGTPESSNGSKLSVHHSKHAHVYPLSKKISSYDKLHQELQSYLSDASYETSNVIGSFEYQYNLLLEEILNDPQRYLKGEKEFIKSKLSLNDPSDLIKGFKRVFTVYKQSNHLFKQWKEKVSFVTFTGYLHGFEYSELQKSTGLHEYFTGSSTSFSSTLESSLISYLLLPENNLPSFSFSIPLHSDSHLQLTPKLSTDEYILECCTSLPNVSQWLLSTSRQNIEKKYYLKFKTESELVDCTILLKTTLKGFEKWHHEPCSSTFPVDKNVNVVELKARSYKSKAEERSDWLNDDFDTFESVYEEPIVPSTITTATTTNYSMRNGSTGSNSREKTRKKSQSETSDKEMEGAPSSLLPSPSPPLPPPPLYEDDDPWRS